MKFSPPPALRLLLPFMIGIILGQAIPPIPPTILFTILVIPIPISFFCLGNRFPHPNHSFPLCVYVFCIVLGCTLCQNQRQTDNLPTLQQGINYEGTIQEPPQSTKRTYRCIVRTNNHNYTVYFIKDTISAPPTMGDRILYRQKNTHGKHFVFNRQWKCIGNTPLTFRQQALLLREHIIERYAQWGFSASNLPIISALTVGHKGALTPSQRDEFAHAGIAHVLALSGLHIGFIWLLIQCLLYPLRFHSSLRYLKWMLATTLLWLFALLAGLAPSVIRAVLMCTLMELSLLCHRKALSLNTISLSALIMLAYNPLYLFNVGFQLSFLAVLSIIAIVPSTYQRFHPSNIFSKWIFATIMVSIAAQIGTAPLVMHYFHYFSLHFLLANLFTALLVPLILYGIFACMLFSDITPLQTCCVNVVDTLTSLLGRLASTVSQLPFSSLDVGNIGWIQVVLIYLAFILLFVYLKYRRPKQLIFFLSSIVILLAVTWILS